MISGERYRLRQQERIGTKVREMYAEMSRLSLSPRLRLLVRQIKAHRGAPALMVENSRRDQRLAAIPSHARLLSHSPVTATVLTIWCRTPF
jgi:hypothetical protein